MIRRAALVAILLMSTAACGSSSAASLGVTPQTVSLQPGDLPAGMVRCDLSGDIASFMDKEKSADPTTYATVKSDWDAARGNGASSAYTALYTDSSAHCAQLRSNGADPGAATYKLVVNFVFQFKDAASATSGYSTGSFFHFSVSDLKSSGAPVIEGTATGLTDNSIIRNAFLASQTVFVSIWQNQTFLVILAILNVDSTASQKAAVSENARIR
ncbi:MAG: hypothetical protein ACHQ0J_02760 [Candidatus Dormibacterales bacterium]